MSGSTAHSRLQQCDIRTDAGNPSRHPYNAARICAILLRGLDSTIYMLHAYTLALCCAQASSRIVPASRHQYAPSQNAWERACHFSILRSFDLCHNIRLIFFLITTSSCIADYTASRALHSSLTSTANTAIPPVSQTPCATKTGTSFCTRRTAKCPSRSSRPPATPCKRAVVADLLVAMVGQFRSLS